MRTRSCWVALAFVAVAGCVTTRLDKKPPALEPVERDAAVDAAVVTELPSAMTPLTPELRNQLMSSACSVWYGAGLNSPALVDLVVDVSESMSAASQSTGTLSKWEVTRSVLQDVINHLPQTVQLGLVLFPNRDTPPNESTTLLDAAACVNTAAVVPIDWLGKSDSAHRQSLANQLQAAEPRGATPTEDALRLAFASSVVPALDSQPGTPAHVILVTDGQPTLSGGWRGGGDESTAVDYQPVIDLISKASVNYGIQTFVIGAPGSERDVSSGADVRYWLSHAANSGQTGITADCSDKGLPNFCHYDLSQVPDFTASLERTLRTITGLVLSCKFAVPQPDTGTRPVDPNAINVVYDVNDEQNQELLVARTDSDCTGDGWYLDSTDNVVLCPKTCAVVQQNPDAEINIIGGCESLILIN